MATMAVFLALGGSAYALTLPKNSVGPKQLKTNAVTGQDALESSFDQVPSAAHADSATIAGSAAHADTAASAGNATNATNAANATHAESSTNAGNAGNADKLDNLDSADIGLGFFTGRVNNLVTGAGTKGSPPSGLSTPNSSATLADEDLTLSPSRPIVMRALSVALTQPVACGGVCGSPENVTVTLEAFVGAVSTASISCQILTGFSSCSAAGPSATVPASSALRVTIATSGDAQFAAGTDALFSWRATAP